MLNTYRYKVSIVYRNNILVYLNLFILLSACYVIAY